MDTYLTIILTLIGLYLVGMGLMGYYNQHKTKS